MRGAAVYVAGPMRGKPKFNADAFDAASKLLSALGASSVVNPVDLDAEQGIDLRSMSGEEHFGCSELASMLRRDISVMLSCDAIALLPGWQRSEGASLEAFVASRCGLDLFEVDLAAGKVSRWEHHVRLCEKLMSRPSDVLQHAAELVGGDRNADYGPPEQDLGATAEMWGAYLSRLGGRKLSAKDVCAMMVLLKMSRAANSPHVSDHWVDAAGYAAIAGSMW